MHLPMAFRARNEAIICAVHLLSVAIDDRAQMDGVLAGAGAPEAAPMAPKLTRSLSGDKPWRCYEESYTQALCLLGLHLLWPGLLWLYLQRLHLL
jgi:hypothetical protein